jgi:phosphopantothenoylcysteine decarboxylase/phosphopantothenate--cysteine ligase
MSQAAQKFIGVATIEGLSGEKPITDMFATGSVMDHIHLARWADLILMAPASANTINKMAAGIGDDIITTLFLAHDFQKPFLLTPAMNTKMYLHPATQKSLALLRESGIKVLETASGILACGEVGYGRLLEPDLILNEIESNLTDQNIQPVKHQIIATQARKILITSGGTQEPIDDVRMITNKSTGRTAAYIADQLIQSGFEVTYLHAENARQPVLDCQKINFDTFSDLDQKLSKLLINNHFDFVIHAAAVSDYSIQKSVSGKIDSFSDELTIHLKKNPKLIQEIKKLSPKSKLIGFKLTSTNNPEIIRNKVQGLLNDAQCDFVVQNDWSTVKTGRSLLNLYSKNGKNENLSLDDLVIELSRLIITLELV